MLKTMPEDLETWYFPRIEGCELSQGSGIECGSSAGATNALNYQNNSLATSFLPFYYSVYLIEIVSISIFHQTLLCVFPVSVA